MTQQPEFADRPPLPPRPSSSRPVVLITGATRGLGRETAHRLSARGLTVWLGARDLEAGTVLAKELAAANPAADLHAVQLDVTDDASVAAAVATITAAHGYLDVLVNNAGIIGGPPPGTDPADTAPTDFLACFGVNLLGPVRVTRAFLPLLRAATHPHVVMVSSGMGSITRTSDPLRPESSIVSLVYPASKAALNMITTQYAKALPDVRVNAIDPGYTATDLNAHSGFQTLEQGTDAIVAAVLSGPDGPTGTFSDAAGPVPW